MYFGKKDEHEWSVSELCTEAAACRPGFGFSNNRLGQSQTQAAK
jgi:hypothetical protein